MSNYEPVIIKKYKDLPKSIKRSMKNMGIKFSELSGVKKVYWGAYILMFHEGAGITLKMEDMIKGRVVSIDNICGSFDIAIKPILGEHDMVKTEKGIDAGDGKIIPKGTIGTIVNPVNKYDICFVEFDTFENAVVPINIAHLKAIE